MAAHEQGPSQSLLQPADPGGDGRLGDIEIFRRAVEIAGIGDLQEGLDLIQVHAPHSQ